MRINKINITGYKGKRYNIFNINIDKVRKSLSKEGYIIHSVEEIEMELDKNDYISDDGYLATKNNSRKPAKYSKEDMAIIRSVSKTLGSIDVPFKDILGY